jgi:hypothetical protein
MAVWEAALAAEWNARDVWVHGEVTGSNLLLATTGCAASSTSDAPRSATRPAMSRQRGRCSRASAVSASNRRFEPTPAPGRRHEGGLCGRH